MKLYSLLNAAFIAPCVSAANTPKKLFEDLQATNYAGDFHELRWTTNQSYNLELRLVEQKADGWDHPTETLLEDYFMEAGKGAYNWTVPEVDGIFALCLHGVSPDDSSIHHENQSYWFQIKSGDGQESELNEGSIAGIVVGTVGAGVVLLSLAVIGLIRWRRNSKANKHTVHDCEQVHQRMEDNASKRTSFDSVDKAKAANELDLGEIKKM